MVIMLQSARYLLYVMFDAAVMRHAPESGQVMDLSNENVKLYVDINIY